MEVESVSKQRVRFYLTAESHIPEGSNLNIIFKYCIDFNSICIILAYYLFNFITLILSCK